MDTPAPRFAIIAALEREVRALAKGWRKVERNYEGRPFTVFESGNAVLCCGGIGSEAARRAAEAAVAIYQPQVLMSAGFAGALDAELKVGQILWPRTVVDAKDGSRTEAASGQGSLVSFSAVAGPEQKAKLASAYGAQVVDMEAAAVARTAQGHGIAFLAVKVVSDEASFEMPDMGRFVTPAGQFRSAAFAGFAVVRPWLWAGLIRLARNSGRASQVLCIEIERYLRESVQNAPPALQAASRVGLN